MSLLFDLDTLDDIVAFYKDIARGRYPVKERDEWLEWVSNDVCHLERILATIARILFQKNTEVIYPLEFIVVPRYPFSKNPMIKWLDLQDKPPEDYEVNLYKYHCSRLGKLINSAVIMKNLVVIDIDFKDPSIRKLADVETRRGYHIVRYIEGYEAVEVNGTTKSIFHCSKGNIEVASGKLYLWSYPLQSRYLEYIDGKINVLSYKILSKDLFNALHSGDIEPIRATPEDIQETIVELFKALGLDDRTKGLRVRGVEKLETTNTLYRKPNPRESRFNANPLGVMGGLDYDEFKEKLSHHLNALPKCISKALYGFPEKGSRYYHLRLLLAVLPFFVSMTEENMEKLVRDFSSRTASKPSEVREWFYHTKYFTGKVEFGAEKIHAPSRLGVPAEAWTFFETAGYCDKCPIRVHCLSLDPSKRRKVIVEYIEGFL